MSSKTNKKDYEAPQLTVVSFKVERGYALSTLTIGREPFETEADYGMQDYDVQEEQHWF